MSTCTIYYPGLLGPDVPFLDLKEHEWPAQDQLIHIAKCFCYGQITRLPEQNKQHSIEARILNYLGVVYDEEQDVPVAHVRMQNSQKEGDFHWCLDPVHVQIDLDEAILHASESLELTEQEARHLIRDLNKHFEEDELYIQYQTPHQWLLKGRFELSTYTPTEVKFKNINEYQPYGKDQSFWRRLINEVQMFLHMHPVNQQRELAGKLPVNSLWLWGGGRYASLETTVELVYGEHALIANVASISNFSHKGLPFELNADMIKNRNCLMIFSEQMDAIDARDIFAWFEYMQTFSGKIIAPLVSMLAHGDLDKLLLHSDAIDISLTKKDLNRWWRRTRAFRNSILQLRQLYAH